MDTTSVGIYSEYIVAWREHEREAQLRTQERAARARAAAETCAAYLAEHHDVRRVWLFGSLVQPLRAHAQTDIDLAVEGLAPADYFMALAGLYTLVDTGVEIDLVPIETRHSRWYQNVYSPKERFSMQPSKIPGLIADLDLALANLQRVASHQSEVVDAINRETDFFLRSAAGVVLQDFYNTVEKTLQRIATELDGSLPSGEAWHQQLVQRMTVAIPGRRPAVLDQELANTW